MGRKKKSDIVRNNERKFLSGIVLRKLERKAFHEISIQELSNDAGISKGAFFLIFSSKAELLVSLISQYMESCFVEMDSALESRILTGIVNDEVPISERRDVIETAIIESFFPEKIGILSLFSHINIDLFSQTGKEGDGLSDLLDRGFDKLTPKVQLFLPEISGETINILCHQIFNLLVMTASMGFSLQLNLDKQKLPFGFSHSPKREFKKQLSLLLGGYGDLNLT